MKKSLFLIPIFALAATVARSADNPRSIRVLDRDWRFINADKAGAEKPNADETLWERVRVPHDWAIGKPFDMNIDDQVVMVTEDGESMPTRRTGRTGALPWIGVGWYRQHIFFNQTESARRHFVEFDGAMSNAKVYMNGKFVGERPYGYIYFSFDVTPYIEFGKENVLAVRLENPPASSRWYPGAGLYRQVRLVSVNPVHVAYDGTVITTPDANNKAAKVVVRTTIDAPAATGKDKYTMVTDLCDASGKVVATAKNDFTAAGDISQEIQVKNPTLWSLENPVLYTAKSKILSGTTPVDNYDTNFGIRTLKFDAQKGFFLNGKPAKFKGVCMHHDLGPIGAAFNIRAAERQLEILKQMGCNAIRTSHNPPAPQLLDLCDRMGFLVFAESFDEWQIGKNENGYHKFFDQWSEPDLTSLVMHTRNHPSVIIWSIGNEVKEFSEPNGAQVAKRLRDICHRLDPTRPVSAAVNRHHDALRNGFADALDIMGFNYKPHDYKMYHEKFPMPFFGSETASTVSSRGWYFFPAEPNNKNTVRESYQTSSYDTDYVPWGQLADMEFAAQDDNAFLMGEFVWTGFDYLGEPTPYNDATPARSSYFGIVDLAGIPKDRFYLYQSQWGDKPMLHVLPHWNWPDRLGQNVPVMAYTTYPTAELFVNGKSMGKRSKNPAEMLERYRIIWPDVIYQPGQIEVVAYDKDGKEAARQTVKTAGAPYAIKMTADRATIDKGGDDLSFVTVEIVDKDGNLCPRSDAFLMFDWNGAGRLRALCNGDATDQTGFSSRNMRVFSGKMVAVVEGGDKPGTVTLSASGSVLKPGSVKITVR